MRDWELRGKLFQWLRDDNEVQKDPKTKRGDIVSVSKNSFWKTFFQVWAVSDVSAEQ